MDCGFHWKEPSGSHRKARHSSSGRPPPTHRNRGACPGQQMMEDEKIEVSERSEEQRKDRLGDEIWGGRILLPLISSHLLLPLLPYPLKSTNVSEEYFDEVTK